VEAPPGFELGVEVLQSKQGPKTNLGFRCIPNEFSNLTWPELAEIPSFWLATVTIAVTAGRSAAIRFSPGALRSKSPHRMVSHRLGSVDLVRTSAPFTYVIAIRVFPCALPPFASSHRHTRCISA
jgi:hypothetical protein